MAAAHAAASLNRMGSRRRPGITPMMDQGARRVGGDRPVARVVSMRRSRRRRDESGMKWGNPSFMPITTVSSWRALDDAITETSRPRSPLHVHSTLVFRGLARTTYSNVSSLARLRGDYPTLERHLIRNFR